MAAFKHMQIYTALDRVSGTANLSPTSLEIWHGQAVIKTRVLDIKAGYHLGDTVLWSMAEGEHEDSIHLPQSLEKIPVHPSAPEI